MTKVPAALVTDANRTAVKEAIRLQQKTVKAFKKAAVDFIKTEYGRDLEAERAHWTSFEVEADAKSTGTVVVNQYYHNEHPPSATLHQTWRIPKRKLIAK